MAMIIAKCANKSEKVLGRQVSEAISSRVRSFYGASRIGSRDWVGFGPNGRACYMDEPIFPFPAIRFRENTKEVMALREKEKGDWRCLSCEEKKALYRSSFNQTFAEFQHPTGEWKPILGLGLTYISLAFWFQIYSAKFVQEPFPESLLEENRRKILRRMLDLHVNPIDGLSSKWDYDNDHWK